MNIILSDIDDFQERDSGWALKEVVNLAININNYTPQLGSSYIELPPQIKRREACVNVKNNDDACFAWAVVSALYPVKNHPHRESKYPHYSTKLDLEGISFPISRANIDKFEKQNNVSINVYVLNKKEKEFMVVPNRLTKNRQENHVNLLLVQDRYDSEEEEVEKEEEPIRYHYVWIKSLSRLLSSQVSKHKTAKFFCERCLHYFYSEEKLLRHIEDCEKLNDYRVMFPKQDKVKFENFKNKERSPFVVYADFECILKPISQKTSNTERYQQHEAHSIGYYFKCSYDESLSYYRSYRGPDCAKWFSEQLQEIAENTSIVFQCPLPMNPLTSQQIKDFMNAKACHICQKCFTAENIKVKDHCHLTGKYRGPAHQGCNINYKDSQTIPVVFHNLSNYDAHLLIRDVSNSIPGKLKIIPNNTEKYISIIKNMQDYNIKFKFIDSFRFMASSLDKLASYLDEKKILRSEFRHLTDEKFNLLTRKGIFPYEYIKGWENLKEDKLPPLKEFYSSLKASDISRKDYDHAQQVWRELEIKDLGEYSDLYLKQDVLLLADIFENFRSSCQKNYGLDPAHYYTAPGLAWDAMLKYTGVELDIIKDVDMLMFLEKGIRGGLTQCSKRKAEANNKYMPKDDAIKQLNSEYLPKDDASKQLNNEYMPKDDASKQLNNEYMPKDDARKQLNNEYMPKGDASKQSNNEYTPPKDDANKQLYNEYMPKGGASKQSNDEYTPPKDDVSKQLNNEYMSKDDASKQLSNEYMPKADVRKQSNNKYIPKYDPCKQSKFIMYYDINAMYSWAMSQYLPYGGLEWVDDIKNFNFNVADDSPVGYILEVDLEYPEEIHDRHKDLPMAPENRRPPNSKNKKLLATLYNKERYIVHYRNLKQYLSEGLILTKIHRVLKFKQSDWMKKYIELNVELRKNAKNEFEKNLFKLMCNAVFGKTMENVRLRRDIKLVTAWEGRYGAESLISKPNFHSRTIFDDHLVAVELLKTEVMFNKPIYIGMAILDISKTVLYEFHYAYMKNKYGEKCKLCYTDTDSLIYEIQTEDVYADMQENIQRFDTSTYPENNPYGMPQVNKNVPGLMKDENKGSVMLKFVGLRAKMYSVSTLNDENTQSTTKKAKGVKGYVVKNEITLEDYENCLLENKEMIHTQNSIRSDHHQLFSMSQRKITLSPFDDKRYLIPNSMDTLPWGHHSIMDID